MLSESCLTALEKVSPPASRNQACHQPQAPRDDTKPQGGIWPGHHRCHHEMEQWRHSAHGLTTQKLCNDNKGCWSCCIGGVLIHCHGRHIWSYLSLRHQPGSIQASLFLPSSHMGWGTFWCSEAASCTNICCCSYSIVPCSTGYFSFPRSGEPAQGQQHLNPFSFPGIWSDFIAWCWVPLNKYMLEKGMKARLKSSPLLPGRCHLQRHNRDNHPGILPHAHLGMGGVGSEIPMRLHVCDSFCRKHMDDLWTMGTPPLTGARSGSRTMVIQSYWPLSFSAWDEHPN